MKNKIILFLATILVMLESFGIDGDIIIVRTKDGKNTEYLISEIKEVSFTDTIMQIVKTDGQTLIYDVDQVTTIVDTDYKRRAVDLGLSVKWASMNVGAERSSDYGDYFAWGETETKSSYTLGNSKWSGYYISQLKSRGVTDSSGYLTSSCDAATVNWGGTWRMPTIDEFVELKDNCNWKWTTQNGHNGYKVTGPNGNFIFLPAAGAIDNTEIINKGSLGDYWCNRMYESSQSYCFYFRSDYVSYYHYSMYIGRSVRPVTE